MWPLCVILLHFIHSFHSFFFPFLKRMCDCLYVRSMCHLHCIVVFFCILWRFTLCFLFFSIFNDTWWFSFYYLFSLYLVYVLCTVYREWHSYIIQYSYMWNKISNDLVNWLWLHICGFSMVDTRHISWYIEPLWFYGFVVEELEWGNL